MKTCFASIAPLIVSFALSAGCALELEEDADNEAQDAIVGETTQALDNVGPSLSRGVRTTIASVTGAENQLFTSTGRLFVTGDKGIFELRKNASGGFERLTRAPEQKAPFCQFGGIAEARGTLYANCYGITDSYLFAATLTAEPSFRSVAKLSGTGFANGLTSDDQGRLYIATTYQNQILRFTFSASDPLLLAQREVWQNNAGGLSNGLKHHAGTIYWSDVAAIKRNTVERQFATPPTLVADLAYFDDLQVDTTGLLAADFGNGVLRAYDLHGARTGVSPQLFNGPSSVGRALGRAGLGQNTLVITERNANRVSVLEPQ